MNDCLTTRMPGAASVAAKRRRCGGPPRFSIVPLPSSIAPPVPSITVSDAGWNPSAASVRTAAGIPSHGRARRAR